MEAKVDVGAAGGGAHSGITDLLYRGDELEKLTVKLNSA